MTSTRTRILAVISKPSFERSHVDVEIALPWLQKNSDLLHSLDKNILSDIVKTCECVKVEKNHVIIQQGQKGDRMFVILDGSVSVYVDSKLSGEDERLATNNIEQKVIRRPPISLQEERTLQSIATETASDVHPDNATTKDSQDTVTFSSASPEYIPGQVMFKIQETERERYGKCVVKFEAGKCFGELALINKDSIRNATVISDEDCAFMIINRSLFNSTVRHYEEQEYEDRAQFVQNHPLFSFWHPKFQKLLVMSLVKESYAFDCPVIKQGDPFKGLYFLRKGFAKVLVEPGKHVHQYPSMSPFKSENDVYEIELGRPAKGRLLKKLGESERKRAGPIDHVTVKRKQGYAAAEQRIFHRCITLSNVNDGEIFGDVEMVHNLPTNIVSVTTNTEAEFYVLTVKNFERLVLKKYMKTLDILRAEVETKLRNKLQTPQGSQIPLLKHLLFKMVDEQQPVIRSAPVLQSTKILPPEDELQQQLVWAFEHGQAEMCNPLVHGAVYYREMMKEKARVRQEQMENQQAKKRYRLKLNKVRAEKPRTTKELKQALGRQKQEEEEAERRLMLAELRQREDDEINKMNTSSINLRNYWYQFQDPLINDGNNQNNSNEGPEREPTFVTETKRQKSTSVQNIPKELESSNSSPRKSKQIYSSATDLNNHEYSDESDDDYNATSSPNQNNRRRKDSFVERMMFTLSQKGVKVSENPEYRNWETSDTALTYLEERLKKFISNSDSIKTCPLPKELPRLKRYQVGDEIQEPPRPGARVVVQRKSCPAKITDCAIINHEHASYHVLPKIGQVNFEELKKNKMIAQRLLDDKRHEWLRTNGVA